MNPDPQPGAYPGGMHRMHVHPPSPPCASPPGHVHPPLPLPKKKMQVCLPKHNDKFDNNLLTVEPRAVDLHCFDADPDPVQNLNADPDPDPGGGGGCRSAKNVHPPWQNPRYAPVHNNRFFMTQFLLVGVIEARGRPLFSFLSKTYFFRRSGRQILPRVGNIADWPERTEVGGEVGHLITHRVVHLREGEEVAHRGHLKGAVVVLANQRRIRHLNEKERVQWAL